MIKIFVLVTAFFISAAVNASDETVCPSTITCNYDSGTCNTPSGWYLADGLAQEMFSGTQTFAISAISAYMVGSSPPNEHYGLECWYKYGEGSSFLFYTTVKSLIGANWVFSGFGNKKANCSYVSDPTTCAGGEQFT